MKKQFFKLIIVSILFILCSFNLIVKDKQVSDFKLKNAKTNKLVSLSDYKNAKGFIIIFTCNKCPMAKFYSQRLNQMNDKYKKIGVPLIFNKVLKPHQIVRILSTFGKDDYKFSSEERTAEINKEFAKLGTTKKKPGEKIESYNVKQSKIAIGSGGFWGKGFLQGTQTRGDFVPAQNTDFIFSSVGENFGFFGCLILLIIYFGLMFRLVFLAERQRSIFSRVYMYCVVGILFFHVALNVCMTLGLAPSPGITLPLISYGGSSLITFTVLLFIAIKLDSDRQMILR